MTEHTKRSLENDETDSFDPGTIKRAMEEMLEERRQEIREKFPERAQALMRSLDEFVKAILIAASGFKDDEPEKLEALIGGLDAIRADAIEHYVEQQGADLVIRSEDDDSVRGKASNLLEDGTKKPDQPK